MRLSKVAMKRLVLLVLAIACLVPAMPAAAAEPERLSRTEALAALKKSDPEERLRRGLWPLERKQMPARDAHHAEMPARRRKPRPSRFGRFASADHPGRHAQTRQLLREPVRERPVDAVLDSRIESEPHATRRRHHPQRHVVAQALGIEVLERPLVAKMRVGLVGGGPLGTAAARRAGGRYAVGEAEALHHLEHRPLPAREDRRIQ